MSNHLKEINKSYLEHMRQAQGYSWKVFKISLVLFLHAFFPNIFVHYASKRIESIREEMKNDATNN